MSEDSQVYFWIAVAIAFVLIRIVSVKWIEPFLQRHARPTALDRLLHEDSVRGNGAAMIFGLLIIALPWAGPYAFRFFDPAFYHPPGKIAWARLALTVIGGLIAAAAFFQLLRLKRTGQR